MDEAFDETSPADELVIEADFLVRNVGKLRDDGVAASKSIEPGQIGGGNTADPAGESTRNVGSDSGSGGLADVNNEAGDL